MRELCGYLVLRENENCRRVARIYMIEDMVDVQQTGGIQDFFVRVHVTSPPVPKLHSPVDMLSRKTLSWPSVVHSCSSAGMPSSAATLCFSSRTLLTGVTGTVQEAPPKSATFTIY